MIPPPAGVGECLVLILGTDREVTVAGEDRLPSVRGSLQKGRPTLPAIKGDTIAFGLRFASWNPFPHRQMAGWPSQPDGFHRTRRAHFSSRDYV